MNSHMRQRLISAKKQSFEAFNTKNLQTIKKIGQGAFGTVYLVEDSFTKKKYAVKKFFVGATNEKEKQKALLEISIQGACNHTHVVRMIHTEWQEQLCCMFMEYCPYDLQQFIQGSCYPLDHETIRVVAVSLLNALCHIHQKGYIHRDLKPANVMITGEGVLKLGDFGCATAIREQFSVEGFSKWYTAPEILFGSRSYGTEIDMWSFGCIMGELINGVALFPGSSEIEQLLLIGQTLGSANETNWPSIVRMPDYGKINFKFQDPKAFAEVFPLANEQEIDILRKVLCYENRASATELLSHPYLKGVATQIAVGQWLQEKSVLNPYFNYMTLV